MVRKILCLSIILLLFAHTASAAPENPYKITYNINVREDGTAVWNVEYRTLLVTKEDFDSFENYTRQLQSIYLKEFKELMQNSVSEASNATSRKMTASGFAGDAQVQSAPTGTFGVVHYSFKWTNFAKTDSNGNINVGDVFVGGLYLSKDNTLIMQYPSSYAVERTTPPPDQVRDGMIWYGLRSFRAGEPEIVLLKTSSSWMLYPFILIVIASGIFLYMRKARKPEADAEITETLPEIAQADMMDLEDRIVKLLKDSGGSLYQSDIGKKLDLPKSTVSSALIALHNRNLIQKIKKGRENLIRLV